MSSIPWVSSPSSSHQCPHGVVGGGGCGQPTRWPTFPIPQTTELGPWRFLGTLTPISSQMEISAALSGLQVGVSSVSAQGRPRIHVAPMDPGLIP